MTETTSPDRPAPSGGAAAHRRPVRRTAVAAALAAGVALSGCSATERPGAAAVVGGQRIDVRTVQQSTTELLEARGAQGGGDPADAQRATLGHMILSRVLEAAAKDRGVEVSSAQVAQRRREFEQSFGGAKQLETAILQENVAPSYGAQFLKDIVTIERLGEDLVPGDAQQVQQQRGAELGKLLKTTGNRLDIEVNPRYGTWDLQSGGIAPMVSGGLAKTAAEARADTPAPEGEPGHPGEGDGHDHSGEGGEPAPEEAPGG